VASSSLVTAAAQLGGWTRFVNLFCSSSVSQLLPQFPSPSIFPFAQVIGRH